ncbi:MAG: hypothetical protein ACFFDT_06000 [Candidatus Hodarchaeota archaeon]
MNSLSKRCIAFWNSIKQSPAIIPTKVVISPDHVDEGKKLGTIFKPHEHYFQVFINEMYLSYSREWFSVYDPMVFVITKFNYKTEEQTVYQPFDVPFVVGPMMMKKFGEKIPEHMVFSDTRVAGPHPYRGGILSLAVVLFRITRKNYVRQLLKVVENAARVLDFSTALSTYMKVAGVVMDGVESLFGLDTTKPLIGFSKQFNPSKGFEPSYFALINMPNSKLDTADLWVQDGQLVYGKSLSNAKPFRHADFVLYSITQTSERTDETTLPFYSQWERVVKEATVPMEDNWQSAKSNMLSLYQTLMLSADLIRKQAEKLAKKYKDEMKRIHDNAVEMAELGREKKEPSELDIFRDQSLDILKM